MGRVQEGCLQLQARGQHAGSLPQVASPAAWARSTSSFYQPSQLPSLASSAVACSISHMIDEDEEGGSYYCTRKEKETGLKEDDFKIHMQQ